MLIFIFIKVYLVLYQETIVFNVLKLDLESSEDNRYYPFGNKTSNITNP